MIQYFVLNANCNTFFQLVNRDKYVNKYLRYLFI